MADPILETSENNQYGIEPTSPKRKTKRANGYIQYMNERFFLWVMEFSWPHSMGGNRHQSRLNRQFYPRSYSPGEVTVKGRCPTQERLNHLAHFIRAHHKLLMEPTKPVFDTNDPRLMKLVITGGEGFIVSGWIPNFRILKQGVFSPAPEYEFNFYVAYDNHTRGDPSISYEIVGWFWDRKPETRTIHQSPWNYIIIPPNVIPDDTYDTDIDDPSP